MRAKRQEIFGNQCFEFVKMRRQLCRAKFQESCILLAKNWIDCFPGKKRWERLDRSQAILHHAIQQYNAVLKLSLIQFLVNLSLAS